MSGAQKMALFLGLHLLVCAAVRVLVRAHFFRLERGLFPMLVLIPLWGPLGAVLLHCRPDPASRWTAADTLYDHENAFHPLPQDTTGQTAGIVPLEEALLLDAPAQCRRLLLLLLKDDPSRYCALLEQARRSRDSEVVHYAATAMAQVNKRADLQLQALQKRYQAQPKDPCTVSEYRQLLRQVLDSGVVQGQAAQLRRQQLEEVLQRELQRGPDYECGCQLAQVQLELGKYGAAERTLAVLTEHWPQREEAWLLCLRCAAACRDGAAVQAVLHTIRQNQVDLSAAGWEALCFWQNDTQGGAGDEAAC